MDEFDKIIGYESIKIELKRLCDVIRNQEKYSKLGVKRPHGLLLYGEPGVGKTTMAKVFIEACGRKAFILNKKNNDKIFLEELINLFKSAEQEEQSIILLDDMDKYANGDQMHCNSDAYVTIQTCIDSVKNKDVFVVATANNLRNLPESLLRLGRFDKTIEVDCPTIEDADKIIEYYLRSKNFIDDVSTMDIAKILNGRSCAELETVINEAGILSGYDGKEKISMDYIVRACMRLIYDAPENINEKSPEVIERIAYHEAGHALIAEILEPGSVNIVSVCTHDGGIGGITSYNQANEYFASKKYMENRVLSLLGGKAATEVRYGEVDVGSNNDLHRAFDIIERFVDDYCSTGFDRWESRTSSTALRERKEMQIFSEIERYYQDARKLIVQNREFLDKLVLELINKKTIINKDLLKIKESCNIII